MEFLRLTYIFVFLVPAWGKNLPDTKTFDNGLYPWTISVKVADVAGNSFFGGLEFDLVFKESSQLNVTLPLQEYVHGTKYTFKVQLASADQLQYAVIRTIGFCSNSIPVDVLHLDWVKFQSETTTSSYIKRLNNVAIKDKCQNVRGTVLIDFEELASKNCDINGQTYEHNEGFNMDCTARCRCVNGQIGCVDMCPPFGWLPKPNQTCQEVKVVGKCCESLACVNERGQKIAYLTGNRTTTDATECKLKTVEKVQDDFTRGYPSMVFVCDEQCKRSTFNPAVIINSK